MRHGHVEQHKRDVVEEVDELVGHRVAEQGVFLGAGRRDERQRRHAFRALLGDLQGDHPSQAFAHDVETSGAKARLNGLEHIGGNMVGGHRVP